MIARDIGVQILSGRYKPGDLLHGEHDASLRLQISRTTYREAMRILGAKGMLEMRQNVGTRVTPMEHWHWLDPEILSWACQFQRGESADRISELRRVVEPEVAALAAEKHTTLQLIWLRKALLQLQTSSERGQSTVSAARGFHMGLFRSSHNVYLQALGHTIDQAVGAMGAAGSLHADVQLYLDVFDAVAVRDAASAREAMGHLIRSLTSATIFSPAPASSGSISFRAAAASRPR